MDNFLIYGTQYYRCPTPLPDQWDTDLANIRKSGMNTIKIWAQWRSNCPKEGVYDFEDVKTLLDLAEKHDLKVVINVIMDVAPAWLFEKYPESVMELANGEKLYPQTVGHRQMGGTPGPCYHHEGAAYFKYEFIDRLVRDVADYPALLYWDLWNEPELTCAIAREASMPRMSCYCQASQKAFKAWLKEKYGTIEALNANWLRNYESFDQVEVPRSGETYKDMIEWRLFFADTLVRDLEKRVATVKAVDQKHPVMVHTVPMPYFNMINACSDDYGLAKHCDLFGNSIGNHPFTAAQALSAAPGKRVINAEIHAVPGVSFRRPGISSMEDFRNQIYAPLSRGIQGFMYWQFRPELNGLEGPAWGLTKLDGTPDYRLDYASRVGKALLSHKDLILSARPAPAEIAVIHDFRNEIFSWCAQKTDRDYMMSLEGAFDAFYRLNYQVDILTDTQVQETDLSGYKMIYYPTPYYMSEKLAACLKKYVEAGGTLVSEANFGAYRDEVNLHSTCMPGYGFDKVFGVAEGRCTSTASVAAAYGDQWLREGGDANILEMREGPAGPWKGYLFLEELLPDTASVEGCFREEDLEMPVLTRNAWGKGQAILCGTLAGAAYAMTHNEGTLALFDWMAKTAGAEKTTDTDKGRVDVLAGDMGVIVAVKNREKNEENFTVSLPDGIAGLVNMESGEEICVENGAAVIRMPKDSVRIFAGYQKE